MKPQADARPIGSPGSVINHVAQVISAIEQRDGAVRAFCDRRFDDAMLDAQAKDALPANDRGPLHGLCLAVKEIFDVAGLRCAWGSPIHADRVPDTDCALVARLRDAGAIVLGTVASTEYAMAREAPTTNPHDPSRSPGASSSGSAAAVAAAMADVAIGSQTIGSGIRPAAYCGVIGFKPTHGLISTDGAMPLSETLDHAVIFGSELSVVRAAFEAVAEMADQTKTAFVGETARIALVGPWFGDEVDARTWSAIARFAETFPSDRQRLFQVPHQVAAEEEQCLNTILSADMWRHHAADYGRAENLMSDMLKGWLERGRAVSPQDLQQALVTRARLQDCFWRAAGDVDVMMTVATTGVAPLRSDGTGSRAPQRLWTLLGCPAMTLPIGTIDGLPVGVQLISRPGSDPSLLDFADDCIRAARSSTTTRPTSAR